MEVLSISGDENAQAAAVERDTNKFLFLAGALLAGTAWFFTQLTGDVDALEQKFETQAIILAGVVKENENLQSENSKLEQGYQKLQGEHGKLKDRVLILEQKK